MSSEEPFKKPADGPPENTQKSPHMNMQKGARENTREDVQKGARENTREDVQKGMRKGLKKATPEEHPVTFLKKWGKRLARSMIGLVLMIALLLLALQTAPVRSLLKSSLQHSFNDQFLGELQIGEISGFIPFDVRLERVRFFLNGERAGRDGQKQLVLSAESVSARFDGSKLLQKEIVIGRLGLYKPVISLWNTTSAFSGPSSLSGTSALSELSVFQLFQTQPHSLRRTIPDSLDRKEQKEPLPFRLDFPQFTITEGELHVPSNWLDAKASADSVSHAGFDAAFTLGYGSDRIYVDTQELTVYAPDLWPDPFRAQGEWYQTNERLELHQMRLETGDSYLVTSAMADFEGPAIDRLEPGAPFPAFLSEAAIRWSVDEFSLKPRFVQHWFPSFPSGLDGTWTVSGTGNKLILDRADVFAGDSSLRLSGSLQNALSDTLSYSLDLYQAVLDPVFASAWIFPELSEQGFTSGMIWEGRLHGTADTASVALTLISDTNPLERGINPVARSINPVERGINPLELNASWTDPQQSC